MGQTDSPSADEALRGLQQLAAGFGLTTGPGAASSSSALSQGEAQFRALVEQIPAITFSARLDRGFSDLYISPQVERLLGYTPQEWIADPVVWFDRLHPEDRAVLNQAFTDGCQSGGPFFAECRFVARDGSIVWVRGEARLIVDERGVPYMLQGVAFDISATKRAEQVMRAALEEKELLLREIHHRVKNNLQVICTLLQMQARRLPDDAARAALRDAEGRVRSMALVHEGLYRAEDVAAIDLAEHVRRLCATIRQIYGRPGVELRWSLEPAVVSIDQAIPSGLLLHELIINSYEHGFGDGRPGVIEVEVAQARGECTLRVRDDGAGQDERDADEHSLGLTLVRALGRQLNATVEVDASRGRETTVRFALRGAV